MCMTGKGYHYNSPVSDTGFNIDVRTVPRVRPPPRGPTWPANSRTHLVDTWFNVEVAYQKQWDREHADQFHKAKSDHDTTVKLVSEIISSSR